MKKYFTTRSKTYAYSIQYVTGKAFYKFQNENDIIYSFEIENTDKEFYKKINKLNNIRFS
ncbi:MAG: hypothetical protein ACLTDM_04255 [Clostridium butyricum]